jgi:UDP-2,3-diacylglucosamine pyrophosphatase LpxH
MIIVIADLHLGDPLANKAGFSNFIQDFLEPNQDDISRIVLLGDILDLWGRSNSQVLLQNRDILTRLGQLDMTKNYIAGNHDYAIFTLLGQSSVSIPADTTGVLDKVSEILELQNDGLKLRFIHGHQIDYWAALDFYEIFCQAMCFVDSNDKDLSDVWNIIYRFAENLPEKTRNKVRNISSKTKKSLQKKLGGPIDAGLQKKKTELQLEWKLLLEASDFEDIESRSSRLFSEIEKFATQWEQMLQTIDQYSSREFLPPHLAYEMHQRRREAASFTVGFQDDEFLLTGHGHKAYINQEAMVADAGCWLGTEGSYLKIEDGEVSIHKWQQN